FLGKDFKNKTFLFAEIYKMDLPDFNSPFWFAMLTLIFFLVITGRYFFIGGIFYFVFYLWQPQKWKDRKISNRDYQKGQFQTEIKWSIISAAIFAIAGAFTML